ncbi:hypothetical protein C8F04DRAFT_1192446 [Mycena alexandri]|uniref:Uncharacterized protein n=1 Tax=Mycena alexandri TaxID=1745969 RepID=A0AAD6SBZ5_9AGAR|nr:hypothetical protein C8F04DRAFT_1192446 [Mycena alexandri]
MCTKSWTSGKLAHSVHDQRSVEYVGPILSSLSRLHGGFMQRTGHREVGAEQAQSWGRMWPTEKNTKGEIKHTGKASLSAPLMLHALATVICEGKNYTSLNPDSGLVTCDPLNSTFNRFKMGRDL